MTTLRRLAKGASCAVTLALIAVLVFAAVEYSAGTQPFFAVDDHPSSMSPTLNHGDLAVVYRVPFTSLGVGSVIVFHDPRGDSEVVMHRVTAVGECGGEVCLSTKGDNNSTNPSPDPWNVTQQDYIGKVVLVVPYLGFLSPTLWGFDGLYALLPFSVAVIALALVEVTRAQKGGEERPL
ncbi:MAG: signal peptidase I [Nitrososphaerota archaeon]|nr:signal peptidase I [Nitrososphaerota archaeon]